MHFQKENVFLDLLKITFFLCHHIFILFKMRFLISTKNEILLFFIFGSYGKISENKNRNPTKHKTYFHHHFLFPMKMKTKNNLIKYLINFADCQNDNKNELCKHQIQLDNKFRVLAHLEQLITYKWPHYKEGIIINFKWSHLSLTLLLRSSYFLTQNCQLLETKIE